MRTLTTTYLLMVYFLSACITEEKDPMLIPLIQTKIIERTIDNETSTTTDTSTNTDTSTDATIDTSSDTATITDTSTDTSTNTDVVIEPKSGLYVGSTYIGQILSYDSGDYFFISDTGFFSKITLSVTGEPIIGNLINRPIYYYQRNDCTGDRFIDLTHIGSVFHIWSGSEPTTQPPLLYGDTSLETIVYNSIDDWGCSASYGEKSLVRLLDNDPLITAIPNTASGEINVKM